MKALVLTSLLLLAVASVPAPVHAQQQGVIIVQLQAPTEPLTSEASSVTLPGRVTFTTDITAMTDLMGVPVSYTVTKQPSWATVIISPASDVFPAPAVTTGPSYAVERPIALHISINATPPADTSDVIEITATTGAAPLGKSFTGRGATPVAFDAPDEPCLQHAGMTAAQLESYAIQAGQAYEEYKASDAQRPSDEVTTQSIEAKPLAPTWLAIAACAIVGAGVGLVLRRRMIR